MHGRTRVGADTFVRPAERSDACPPQNSTVCLTLQFHYGLDEYFTPNPTPQATHPHLENRFVGPESELIPQEK